MKSMKLFLSFSAIGFFAVFLLVMVLKLFGYHIYFLEKSPLDTAFMFFILTIGFIWFRLIFEIKRNVIFLVLVISLALGMIIVAPIAVFATEDERWTEYVSPNGEHTLIIRDWSFLLGGSSDYYEAVNEWIIKDYSGEADHFMSCDDGCKPSIVSAIWSDEQTLILTYDGGFTTLQTVRFVFNDN